MISFSRRSQHGLIPNELPKDGAGHKLAPFSFISDVRIESLSENDFGLPQKRSDHPVAPFSFSGSQ